MSSLPSRGEIWGADLNPVRGHEQSGRRPVLVLSVDEFNYGPAELVIVLPLTPRDRAIPFHIPLVPPEGGVQEASFALADAIRSVARERLIERWGTVHSKTMAEVEDRVSILLGL